ncbi:MAG TPA: hypothetical protein ENO36_00820 [Fervidicoccus fontis]|uniref:Dinitrogenase iron-molybdenum cofactor biosynthesis domain-containing protein n=1 Tax=Fervidicoccus fontis TaxID=683846 RepID=A0A7C2UJN9_9CREN|nr:MAG: hypothetical protein C0179_05870 [Fervidicoccus sp.]HEU97386.1 hypothetical protein [Fervidicoccus fontis]
MKIATSVAKRGKDLLLFPHFGRAPYFAFVELKEGKIESIEVLENPLKEHEHGRGRGIIEMILSKKPDSIIALGMGRRAFDHFRENGIKVYFYPNIDDKMPLLQEAIDALLRGELKEASEPFEIEDDEHSHESHHRRNVA